MENPRRRVKILLDLSDQVEYMTADTMTTHRLYRSKGKSGAQSLGIWWLFKEFSWESVNLRQPALHRKGKMTHLGLQHQRRNGFQKEALSCGH